jgi:adhesin/invasin
LSHLRETGKGRLNMKAKWLVSFLAIGAALLFVAGAQAVHDLSFQLDGDATASTTTSKGGHTQTLDWDSFFNSAGAPSPSLPDASRPGFTASAFVRDFGTNPGCSLTGTGSFCTADSTTFTSGSKDTLDITPGWQCTYSNNVNSKTDISNVYAAAYTDPTSGHKLIYFALERNDNSGDGNVAFWFLQDSVGCSSTTNGSNVPFTGHHMDGDILVVAAFSNGGTVSNVSAYKWSGSGASGSLTTTPFATGADCKTQPTGASDVTCATVNVPTISVPWLTANKNDGVGHSLRESEFFEGGLDLTNTNLALKCFSSFLGDTRTSQALNSTIFDYAGGSFQHCSANISIAPGAVNEVGATHTFTVSINTSNAGGAIVPAPDGTKATVTLTPAGGASVSNVSDNCSTTGTVNGTCTVSFTSSSAGTVTAHAAADVLLQGATLHVETNGQGGNSGDAVKRFADANVSITPSAVNEAGHAHTFTITTNALPGGTTPTLQSITPHVTPSPSSTTSSCGSPTINGNTATCTVTINSTVGGTFTATADAQWRFADNDSGASPASVTITRSTDGTHGSSGAATKRYVDARIVVTPPTATNEVGHPHTVTATVSQDDGLPIGAQGGDAANGLGPAPDGTLVTFSLPTNTAGATFVAGNTCTTSAGSCSVQITSNAAGNVAIHGTTTFTVGGLSLTRATGDTHLGDSADGQKTYVDANIQISPLTATNEVGTPHAFTGHVNVNSGGGFVNAPDGTTISFTVLSGSGSVAPATCTTSGGTGSCAVSLTSATTGATTLQASTSVTVGGLSLTRTTGDTHAGDSGNAVKTWVDANIQISPLTATNEVGSPHVLTAHVNVSSGGGFANAPDGTTIAFAKVGGPGSLSASSCTTSGGTGSCTVTLTSSTAGVTTVNASTTVVVGGLSLARTTGDTHAGDSGNATKTYVDANIQISPLTATNEVGTPHTFTAHVNVNSGGGFASAPDGTTIGFAKVSGPGSLSASSCTTSGGTGSCTVTLTSSTAGVTIVNASTTVSVGGLSLTRSTGDTHAGDSGNATKTYVDANIQLSPLTATNEVGTPHTFTAHVNVNSGGGFTNAPAGTVVSFSATGPGSLGASSCTTVGTTGECSVTLTSATAGVTTLQASTTVTVGGLQLTRTTGDTHNGDSGNAVKTWVDANIQISPLTATNEVGSPHTFTAHVNVNSGGGFANAPAGTVVSFSATGPGSLGASSCTTVGTSGECSVTLTSATAGVATLQASTTVTVGGLQLTRTTGDAHAGDSGNAVKTWVDANIQLSPLTATNEVGNPHSFTAHVNVNDGTGFTNAPAGTTVTFSTTGPGSLGASSCTTVGTSGECSVTLTSATAGVTTLQASTTVTVGGLQLTRTTGDTHNGDSANAVKTWVDANIQISPLTATNEVGAPHTFTAHVNVNSGGGFTNAPAGTVVSFSATGPGSLGASSCTTVGTSGECSVTLTSATAGMTTLQASTTVSVGGLSLTRTTGDAHNGDSANAVKTWVDANIQISPLTATNEVGTPHTFTAHVNVNDGTGLANAPDGTTITFTKVNGPGSLSPASCTTVAGSCSVTLTSSTAGVTTANASTAVIVGGLTLHRATGDGLAGDSDNAVKTYVDANIQLSPLTPTNEIGTPHTFTAHVNVNNGSGFANAPDGTQVGFTILNGPGSLGASSCTTSGGTGTCTVTLTSATAGVTTLQASTTVSVGGLSLTRTTGDTHNGDSANAVKTWVDANIQISPPTADNPVGTNHVLTVHVNVNDGTGYKNAPDGTTVNLTLANSGGANATFTTGPGHGTAATSCTTTAGSCTATIKSTTSGSTTIGASVGITVGGIALARSTGDGLPGDSPPANKNWINTGTGTQTNQEFVPQDSATVSAYGTPSGTVKFELFQDSSTCSGTPVYSETKTLSGGSATTSNGGAAGGGFTATGNHTWYWKVTYSGDDNNNPSTSCVESTQITE